MKTWEARIEGIVQGVGFRPFVFQLAKKEGISGEVSNGVEGVVVRFNATKLQAQEFYQRILDEKPRLAHITHNQIKEASTTIFESFQIVESQKTGKKRLHLTPDYALCEDCRREMWEPGNRREQYPFITCTQCGPRYSIILGLPYDRPLTSMEDFPMCGECLDEYNDPNNRRHFSQTNSCPNCGIQLHYTNKDKTEKDQKVILSMVHKAWEKGQIIAIKGIGGAMFTCDATNTKAVELLRSRKQRKSKPFAIMYPSIEKLNDYSLSLEEKEMLLGPVSPILLVKKAPDQNLAEGIAEGLGELGVMIPYNPLFEYLVKDFDKPIVATSGNISGSPILYQDTDQIDLFQVADGVLWHNRDIVSPQDDSLVRFTPNHKQKIILRRSRGLAPSYFKGKQKLPEECILAMGADMKSAFALIHEGNFYISQYLGNLSHFDTEAHLYKELSHLKEVLNALPKAILRDLHPEYASSRIAESEASNLPVRSYQHHKAHFAAVLAENDLLEENEPVLGVIWDGTGLGEDGHIWGSEFFLWENGKMERKIHLDYFRIISGDKMAREPRLSALSMLIDDSSVAAKFQEKHLRIFKTVYEGSRHKTSSMGRLFDAVASVLNICDVQSFEGEAAMKLEALARGYWEVNSPIIPIDIQDSFPNASRVLSEIIRLKNKGIPTDRIAFSFHHSLVEWIRKEAINLKTKKIAFSGGVFQNALLVDLLIEYLSQEFELFFHKQLSPNDENIAFGQLNLYLIENHYNRLYVFSDPRKNRKN